MALERCDERPIGQAPDPDAPRHARLAASGKQPGSIGAEGDGIDVSAQDFQSDGRSPVAPTDQISTVAGPGGGGDFSFGSYASESTGRRTATVGLIGTTGRVAGAISDANSVRRWPRRSGVDPSPNHRDFFRRHRIGLLRRRHEGLLRVARSAE